jgi:hypothetical protein
MLRSKKTIFIKTGQAVYELLFELDVELVLEDRSVIFSYRQYSPHQLKKGHSTLSSLNHNAIKKI